MKKKFASVILAIGLGLSIGSANAALIEMPTDPPQFVNTRHIVTITHTKGSPSGYALVKVITVAGPLTMQVKDAREAEALVNQIIKSINQAE